MALFKSLSTDPQPYILREQREAIKIDPSIVPTVFHLKLMNAREFTAYTVRRDDAEKEEGVSSEARAARMSDIDEETLRGQLTKIEAAWEDDDTIESTEKLGEAVKVLNFARLHELLTSTMNESLLRAGAKNS